jgi:hypothetical protein
MRALFLLMLFTTIHSFGQIGGKYSFSFLDRAFNARTLSFGNSFISVKDNDPNLAISNPALINFSQTNKFSFNHLFQTGNVQLGMINYSFTNKTLQLNQNISLRYIDYGKMKETSPTGEILSEFTPGDFILSSVIGKKINQKLSFGLQTNFLFSQYSNRSSLGISFDFGGLYQLNDTTKTFSFTIKNAGVQLKTFNKEDKLPLPFDFQIAFSHKLKHAPFRFSYLAHHLTKWDLSYYDPNSVGTVDPLTGDSIFPSKASFIKKLSMHFTPQIELLIGKNMQLRVAFDYFRRYQMALTNRPGLSGFSFGFGMNFKRFSIDYGFSSYSAAGSIHGFTFISSLNQWKKKN